MVTPLLDANRRLQMYINTNTRALPEDIRLYQAGGQYEKCCLFCRNPNSTNPVISENIDTWAHMCDFCHTTVTEGITEKLSKYSDSPRNERRKALFQSLDINFGYMIPEFVKKYYIHLDGSKKDYFVSHADRCIICDRLPVAGLYSTEDFNTIEIPVRSDKYLSGGKVHICEDEYCNQTRKDYNWSLETLTELNNHSKTIELVEKSCTNCRQTYLLLGSESEIEYRKHMPDSYEWQCPTCAYEMMNKWEKAQGFQKYYPEVVGDPRQDLIQRAYTRTCYYCLESTSIDLFQTEFSFLLNHTISSNICCRSCSILRTWLELDSVYRMLNSKIYIELSSEFIFSVFRLNKGKLELLLNNCNTGASNRIDALFIAFDEIEKSLPEVLELE